MESTIKTKNSIGHPITLVCAVLTGAAWEEKRSCGREVATLGPSLHAECPTHGRVHIWQTR